MRIFLKVFAIYLLIFNWQKSYSQDTIKIIEFNANKDVKRGGLPYDQEFRMKIRMPNSQPNYFVKLYSHKGKLSFSQSLKHDNEKDIARHYMARIDFEPTLPTSDSILTLHFKHTQAAPKQTFIRRIFRPFNPNSSILKPGRQYSIIINRADNDNDLIRLLQQSFDSNGNIVNGQRAIYQVQYNRQFNDRNIQEISSLNPDDRDLIFTEYQNQIVPTDKRIAAKIDDFNTSVMSKTATGITPADLALSYQYFSGELPLKFIRCEDSCALDKIIKQIHNMTDYAPSGSTNIDLWQLLYSGEMSLNELGPQKTLTNLKILKDDYSSLVGKVTERASSIMLTMADLQQYIIFATNLEIALVGKPHHGRVTALKKALMAESKELQVEITKIHELISLLKERDNLIIYSQRFASLSIIDVNTHIFNFATRNELMITPVFGYAYYGFQKGFNSFTPYLGFQINLQAINKDISSKLITDKTFLQRFNFTTAWTLSPIGDKLKRFDLFSNGSSMLTGMGFKLGHAVSINAGAIWFSKADTNPVLKDKRLAITPFASISVNSELSKLLGDFTKLIPSR